MKTTVTDCVRRGKSGALVQVECESDAEMKAIRAAAKDSGLTVSKWLHHVIVTSVSGADRRDRRAKSTRQSPHAHAGGRAMP